MKMTVKRGYLIQLKNLLEHPEAIFDGKISGEVCYMISMNYEKAKKEFDAVIQAYPFDKTYIEYANKRKEFLDTNGINTDADYDAKDDETKNTINEFLNKLAEEYKESLEAENEIDKERNAFLEREIETDLYTIKPSQISLKETDGWKAWAVLFNNGNGIVRE